MNKNTELSQELDALENTVTKCANNFFLIDENAADRDSQKRKIRAENAKNYSILNEIFPLIDECRGKRNSLSQRVIDIKDVRILRQEFEALVGTNDFQNVLDKMKKLAIPRKEWELSQSKEQTRVETTTPPTTSATQVATTPARTPPVLASSKVDPQKQNMLEALEALSQKMPDIGFQGTYAIEGAVNGLKGGTMSSAQAVRTVLNIIRPEPVPIFNTTRITKHETDILKNFMGTEGIKKAIEDPAIRGALREVAGKLPSSAKKIIEEKLPDVKASPTMMKK